MFSSPTDMARQMFVPTELNDPQEGASMAMNKVIRDRDGKIDENVMYGYIATVMFSHAKDLIVKHKKDILKYFKHFKIKEMPEEMKTMLVYMAQCEDKKKSKKKSKKKNKKKKTKENTFAILGGSTASDSDSGSTGNSSDVDRDAEIKEMTRKLAAKRAAMTKAKEDCLELEKEEVEKEKLRLKNAEANFMAYQKRVSEQQQREHAIALARVAALHSTKTRRGVPKKVSVPKKVEAAIESVKYLLTSSADSDSDDDEEAIKAVRGLPPLTGDAKGVLAAVRRDWPRVYKETKAAIKAAQDGTGSITAISKIYNGKSFVVKLLFLKWGLSGLCDMDYPAPRVESPAAAIKLLSKAIKENAAANKKIAAGVVTGKATARKRGSPVASEAEFEEGEIDIDMTSETEINPDYLTPEGKTEDKKDDKTTAKGMRRSMRGTKPGSAAVLFPPASPATMTGATTLTSLIAAGKGAKPAPKAPKAKKQKTR